MLRYFKYAVLAVIAVGLVSVSMANRQMVELKAMPDVFAEQLGGNFTLPLPLFIVIFAGIGLGLLIGYILEWLREYKQRAEAAAQRREMDRMRRELRRLKGKQNEGKDDVIALLDEAS